MGMKTLKDIARELDISVSTVSRVVNNKSVVNDKTREKVMAALAKTNYVPNQVARSLKKSATKTIGIIVPDMCEVFFGQIIHGIDSVVSKKGYSILLADSNESKQKEERYLDILFQQRVDALVLATVDMSGTKVMHYIDNGVPVVFIDNLPAINVAYDAVLIDNVMAGKMAVNHLLSLGHRRIAAIVGIVAETTGSGRLEGYRTALREAGVPVDENLIAYGNYKEDAGIACMEALLNHFDEHPFSAVCVMSEKMTIGAIKTIRVAGYRIPEDIAVVGFDMHDDTGLIVPSITTLRQPEKQIGELTGEMLIKRLEERKNGVSSANQKMFLMPYLEVHQSCGRKR
jgi:DNA-binding LacI/PurR family transcriptional regulator